MGHRLQILIDPISTSQLDIRRRCVVLRAEYIVLRARIQIMNCTASTAEKVNKPGILKINPFIVEGGVATTIKKNGRFAGQEKSFEKRT
jgi:hypothetical protein